MRLAKLVVAIAALLLCTQTAWCISAVNEQSLGRQYAQEFEKGVKLVTDTNIVERVERIGRELAEVANSREIPASYGSSRISRFRYAFKVIEDEDVNAVSFPGGIIYVNTGLLALADSDDELAGVLAHEIAHAAHHHLVQLIKKNSSASRYVAIAALAGIVGNARTRDLSNLMMGAQMLRTGKMSSYTQEAEKDADRTAVAYVAHSSFNPEGLFTFMKKLEAKHAADPSAPLGIFQTHPSPHKRVAMIMEAMQELGLSVNFRRLRNVAYATAEPVSEDSDQYQVAICGRVVCTPATLRAGQTSRDRAEQTAGSINACLDAGACGRDILCDTAAARLMVRGAPVVDVFPEDMAVSGQDLTEMLVRARKTLEYAMWADWLSARCGAELNACIEH